MLDCVALGELLIDFTRLSEDRDGYPAMQAHPGGAPANFLAALTKFGKKTAMLTKVGDDAFGELLKNTLREAGIGVSGIVTDKNVFTTLAFVTLDPHGDRRFSFARKPGADACLSPDEVAFSLIEQVKIFHFGTLSMTASPVKEATEKAVEFAKAHGKIITFDPNLRMPLWNDPKEAKACMLWGLSKADIVKISDEEVEFLFALAPEAGAGHILENFPVKLVFVTCGANGAYFMTRSLSGFVPSLTDIDVMDTTGAGDIFFGSALSAILDTGKSPEALTEYELTAITRFAACSASLSTTRPGGLTSVFSKEEVLKKAGLF